MTTGAIAALTMPKWGMSMTEGVVLAWLVAVGGEVARGDAVVQVESEKIDGVVEAPIDGILRRVLAQPGEVLAVGQPLGVIAEAAVSDAEIDAQIVQAQEVAVRADTAEQDEPSAETIEVDGRRLRYVRRGEGEEVLLLLHGFGGDLTTWLFNHDVLAQGRTVYALDLPGHGASSKDVGDGDVDDLARVVAGFMRELEIQPAVVIGHSLGGAVAAALAKNHPDCVTALVLVAAAGLGTEMNEEYVRSFVSASSRRELKPQLELLFADSNIVTRRMVDDVLAYKRMDGAQQALRTTSDQLLREGRQTHVFVRELIESSIPILVVWGDEDRIIPAGHAGVLGPRARTTVLEGCGHTPHMEAAGDFNRLVAEFLSDAS